MAEDMREKVFPIPADFPIDRAGQCTVPAETQSYHARKFDQEKPRMDLLPFDALVAVADVLTYGARKYAADSWRTIPDATQRYEAAMLRHLAAYKAGEVVDAKSGLPHLAHLACNALFLVSLGKTQ